MHDRDLPRRPPEVYEAQLHPEPERLPKPYRFGFSRSLSILGRLCVRPISIVLVDNRSFEV
jgi:hypothetical protein